MARGHERERQVRRILEQQGWWTCRAAGSFGDADVVALRLGAIPRLIEVKSTAGGPYERFGPAQREELRQAARKAGAQAWLVWWPPRKEPQFIYEGQWPGGTT